MGSEMECVDSPLEADELMGLADRIDTLAAEDAAWVGRLFQECMRARLHEAELLSSDDQSPADRDECGCSGKEFDAQLAQVALDAAEWLKTLWDVGYMGAGSFPSQPRSAFPLIELEDVLKSALFARIREGKRPLPFPPPTRNGLPWHDLVEGAEDEVHVVEGEIVDDGQGGIIGAIIDACADWRVVDVADKGREYIVQHRGKGPLYRLTLGDDAWLPSASLRREPPRWTRTVHFQERGGFCCYTLEWPDDGGTVSSIPLRAATWERAESEAAFWIATNYPEMYGQVKFERVE